MSRDILIIDHKASIIYRSPTDITYLPVDDSVDVSIIYEKDWAALVESPGDSDSFSLHEQAYLSSMGCTWDAL